MTQYTEDGQNTKNNTWQHFGNTGPSGATSNLEDGLFLKGDRIVVPEALKHSVLKILLTGHQGETNGSLFARVTLFLPGINQSIKDMVKACTIYSKYQPVQPKLQLMQPDLSTQLWATIGTDINEQDECKYLLVVDYYS